MFASLKKLLDLLYYKHSPERRFGFLSLSDMQI